MTNLDAMNEPLIQTLRSLLTRNIFRDDDRQRVKLLLAQADTGLVSNFADPAVVMRAVQRSDSLYEQTQAILSRYR